MTAEEALKIIGAFEANERMNSVEKLDALLVAMDALENQIPKQPIEKSCLGNIDKYVYGFCPNPLCNNGVNYEMAYCDNCGQRIDWSEAE